MARSWSRRGFVFRARARSALTSTVRFARAASAEVDESKLSAFMAEIEGKNVDELIAAGNKKLASVPSGGAGGAAAAGGKAAAGGAAAAAAAPEEEEEEEAAMDFDLFD